MRITGTYINAEGQPVQGKIHFTPNQFVLTDDIQTRQTITAELVDGSFEVTLEDPQEQDWTIRVHEDIPKGRWFDIPAAAGDFDLATLSPVSGSPEPILRGPAGIAGPQGPAGLNGAPGDALDLAGSPTWVYGNSYGVLTAGWFTPGNHYSQKVAARSNGGSVSSYAVGGRRILDVCATLINGTALPGTTAVDPAGEWTTTTARSGLVVLESIINDIGHAPNMSTAAIPSGITSANTRYTDTVKAMYRTALALMSSESRISQSAGTTNGTWDVKDIASGSTSGDSVSWTSSPGAGITYTATPPQHGPLAGKVYFLTYTLDPNAAGVASAIQVSVDGGAPTTFTMPVWEAYVGHDGGATYQAPVVVPVSLPVDGVAHTVKFTHAGSAFTYMYADDLIIPSVNPNPIAVMGAEHPMPGWANPIFGSGSSGLAAYNHNVPMVTAVVKEAAAEFPNAIYVPSTMTTNGLYSGDGLHPNDRGMEQRANDLHAALFKVRAQFNNKIAAAKPNSEYAIV